MDWKKHKIDLFLVILGGAVSIVGIIGLLISEPNTPRLTFYMTSCVLGLLVIAFAQINIRITNLREDLKCQTQ